MIRYMAVTGNTPPLAFCTRVRSGTAVFRSPASGPSPMPEPPWHCAQLSMNSVCPMLCAPAASGNPIAHPISNVSIREKRLMKRPSPRIGSNDYVRGRKPPDLGGELAQISRCGAAGHRGSRPHSPCRRGAMVSVRGPSATRADADLVEDAFECAVVALALHSGLHGIECRAQRVFLCTLAVVPRATLKRHVQHVIADEMGPGATAQKSPVGLVRADTAQGAGR